LAAPLLAKLSPRRRQVLELLNEKHSYKEIAWHLGIAYATVRVTARELRKQLGEACVPLLRRARSGE